MSQLQYEARKNASIYKIPKVYFCCHPMDFDAYYKTISGELLAKQNCSVWHHGNKPAVYDEEFFADLGQMQLFVIPVTRRFLEPGSLALEKEFRFAVEHHIPVLPLMQERGLEAEFNRLCGNIQFLDKYNTDSTCIEYTDKLEKFLASVLVGDEMSRKIREAFDAYIFLSYRKKDRRHAQMLMKLIHDNEFCRDVAIWYDEFLVPGEDFNEAIEEALRKSKLFLLMVTPNLVSEDNYIMDVEFPLAQKHGKTIFPCEMEDTDKTALAERFRGIPECTDGRDSELLARCLRQHFAQVAEGKPNSTPEHLFLIGIAYLNGIDVEVNREYALKLITAAAEQDLPEAINQLISMYTNGTGVKIDTGEAVRWHEKLVAISEASYQKAPDFDAALACMGARFELARALYVQDRYQEAIECADELKAFCSRVAGELLCIGLELLNLQRHVALVDIMQGRLYHEQNDFDRAMQHYHAASEVLEKLNRKLEDPLLLSNTGMLYNYMAQLYKVRAEYAEALDYYRKALEIQQYNSEAYDGEQYLLDQVLTRVQMSEAMRLSSDFNGAMQCSKEALVILDELMSVCEDRNYLDPKMMVLLSLAESYRMANKMTEALAVFDIVEQLEKQFEEYFGYEKLSIRAKRLQKTTQVYFQLMDYEAVIHYGEQAIALLEDAKMTSVSYIATGGTEQGCLYLFLGMAYFQLHYNEETALLYMKKATESAEQYLERDILCNIADAIVIYCNYSDVLMMKGQPAEAGIYLEKVAAIYEKYPPAEDDVRELCGVFAFYYILGRNKVQSDLTEAALEALGRAESYYHKIVALNPLIKDLLIRDYMQLTYTMAACYLDLDDPQTLDYYLKCIELLDQIPEERYHLEDWNIIGIATFQLSCFVKGFLNRRNWRKRTHYAARMIREKYPNEYQQTLFYELVSEFGKFR